MKNYKKILALTCSLLCIASFTSCGNKSEKVLELMCKEDSEN